MTSSIKLRQKQMPPDFINNKYVINNYQISVSKSKYKCTRHNICIYVCGVKCFATLHTHSLFIYLFSAGHESFAQYLFGPKTKLSLFIEHGNRFVYFRFRSGALLCCCNHNLSLSVSNWQQRMRSLEPNIEM